MKLFNYEELYIASIGDSSLMLYLLEASVGGFDFILNEAPLYDSKFSVRDRAEYLAALSCRNLTDYKAYGFVDLPIEQIPTSFDLSYLIANPLIELSTCSQFLIFPRERD